MKRSFLKELGLESEAIDKIMAENGKDIERYKSDIEDYTSEIKELKATNADNSKAIKEAVEARENELKTEFEEKEKEYKEKLEKTANYDSVCEELEGLKKSNLDRESSERVGKFFEEQKVEFTSSFAKDAIVNKFKEKEFKLSEDKFGDDVVAFLKEMQENNKDAFKVVEEIKDPLPYFSKPGGGEPPKEGSKFGFTSMFSGVRPQENKN